MDSKTVIEAAIQHWVAKNTGAGRDQKLNSEAQELADSIHRDLGAMCGALPRDINHEKWSREWRAYIRAKMTCSPVQAAAAYDRLDQMARSSP